MKRPSDATASGVSDEDLAAVEVHLNGADNLSPEEAVILRDAMRKAYGYMAKCPVECPECEQFARSNVNCLVQLEAANELALAVERYHPGRRGNLDPARLLDAVFDKLAAYREASR